MDKQQMRFEAAKAAMQAMLTKEPWFSDEATFARRAVQFADALLAELVAKEGEGEALSWASAPDCANWLVTWPSGSQEWRTNYPWPDEGRCIVAARPVSPGACERCGPCRRQEFKTCKNGGKA